MMPTVTGRTAGQPATLADYVRLFRPIERPRKFAGVEVGFRYDAGLPEKCGNCRHYFINPARDKRVCEIMRLPGEVNVPSDGVCRFWNRDGGTFPLLLAGRT